MSPREVADFICAGAIPFAGLVIWGLYRLILRFEKKSLGKTRSGSGGGAGLLFELDKLTRPSIEHVVEAQQIHPERDEHGGE